jgi:hypothetical protein
METNYYSTITQDLEREKFMMSVVLGWRDSGMSKSKYCKNNNITPSEFGYWRRKLNIPTSCCIRSNETHLLSVSESTKMDFLSLSTSDESLEKINANKLLCVELPNGIKITFY